ncbi:hypothetical protein Lesp02_20210 [Lentzea sp. NBRC 105346]|uniref:hypothetical protein n=1 Tax=Lentzea sp. NBRC 105346 TaxID=3032205 RepID=UPI0024A59AFC|nr:hypothetical protein [Lentzea sp. NBRC 105346]GLZ29831.1 hypothetical protein Lesp02_20210 [Lentzea sp. NBRC 105346]
MHRHPQRVCGDQAIACLDRVGDHEVGFECVAEGVDGGTIGAGPAQAGAQPEEIRCAHGSQRASSAFPPLDGGEVDLQTLGETGLRQRHGFADELEHEAGHDRAATCGTRTAVRCSTGSGHCDAFVADGVEPN